MVLIKKITMKPYTIQVGGKDLDLIFVKYMDKNQTIIVLNNVKRGRFLNIDRLIELIN